MKIIADNKIPGLLDLLEKDFELVLLPLEAINAEILRDADILICRSVLRVNQALLENTRVSIVATATSGTDHIDQAYLEKQGITLFSAAGSNAQGVADYMLWMIVYLTKNEILSENSSANASGKFSGKTAGIIGAGHVGTKVKNVLEILGFKVLMNDPPKAQKDPRFISTDLEIIAQQDLICVHAELTKNQPFPSFHLLDSKWFQALNKKAILINAARGAIIDTEALIAAKLDVKKSMNICLDVYENEPNVPELLIEKCEITTPHIAGHTIESFYRATEMVVEQIRKKVGVNFNHEKSPLAPLCKGGNSLVEHCKKINAAECQHWYDIILKLYNFQSKLDLTPTTFYTLRESHRIRHDFSAIPIQISQRLPKADRLLLEKLQLNLHLNQE